MRGVNHEERLLWTLMSLLATGISFEMLMPEKAREVIEQTGIERSELSSLRGDELADAVRDLEVDFEDKGGNTLSLRCE